MACTRFISVSKTKKNNAKQIKSQVFSALDVGQYAALAQAVDEAIASNSTSGAAPRGLHVRKSSFDMDDAKMVHRFVTSS